MHRDPLAPACHRKPARPQENNPADRSAARDLGLRRGPRRGNGNPVADRGAGRPEATPQRSDRKRRASHARPLMLLVMGLAGLPGLTGCALLAPNTGASSPSQNSSPPPGAPTSPAAVVENAWRNQGLVFGTDGTVESLYAYGVQRHKKIAPEQARVGDVLFFNTKDNPDNCGGHAGLVDGIRPGGALSFREYRDGKLRHSHAHPEMPTTRRDENGRIVNSFLRPKRPDDSRGARYFAGEMLCAVVRTVAAR